MQLRSPIRRACRLWLVQVENMSRAGIGNGAEVEGKMESLQPIVVIIIGLVLLAVAWKIISGIFRLVLTVVVIGAVIYFLLPYLGG